MLFYKHANSDGSASWPIQAQKISNSWNFRQVFAGLWTPVKDGVPDWCG